MALEDGTQEKVELKRFFRYEKEGILNINHIALKQVHERTPDEKSFMIMFLRYKVPFFKSFQREVISMICEKFEQKQFVPSDISNYNF